MEIEVGVIGLEQNTSGLMEVIKSWAFVATRVSRFLITKQSSGKEIKQDRKLNLLINYIGLAC